MCRFWCPATSAAAAADPGAIGWLLAAYLAAYLAVDLAVDLTIDLAVDMVRRCCFGSRRLGSLRPHVLCPCRLAARQANTVSQQRGKRCDCEGRFVYNVQGERNRSVKGTTPHRKGPFEQMARKGEGDCGRDTGKLLSDEWTCANIELKNTLLLDDLDLAHNDRINCPAYKVSPIRAVVIFFYL